MSSMNAYSLYDQFLNVCFVWFKAQCRTKQVLLPYCKNNFLKILNYTICDIDVTILA